jgi:hypothetical protein
LPAGYTLYYNRDNFLENIREDRKRMEKRTDEIVNVLEKLDDDFRKLPEISDMAMSLWEKGLDLLGTAIWTYEKTLEAKESLHGERSGE